MQVISLSYSLLFKSYSKCKSTDDACLSYSDIASVDMILTFVFIFVKIQSVLELHSCIRAFWATPR